MKRSPRRVALGGVTILLAGSALALTPSGASAQPFGYHDLKPIQQRLASGLLASELDSTTRSAQRSATARAATAFVPQKPGAHGCETALGSNVKVNTNCLNLSDPDLQGRGQSQNEPWIAADPNNPARIVASYNDYRRGDGTCGVSYTLDGGKTWTDATTPDGFVRGDFAGKPREYWQASGDTSVAWDTRGNAYLSCQAFNRGSSTSPDPDQSSAFYVYRSTGTSGASWNFPGREVTAHDDTAGAGDFLLDKQLMTVDAHADSPYADRIYVTWTTFAADGTGYIYEAHSADYGESFSAPVLVSAAYSGCTTTYDLPTPQGPCNENQDSQPFTAPDGTLYVVYNNYNNTPVGDDNRNQVLLARSTDGGSSFSPPVKVTDFYDLPDCDTYQGEGSDPGRACVVEKGTSAVSLFRANNYPVGAVDPIHPDRVVVTFGSYINRHSNEGLDCTPAGFADDGINLYDGVKTGGCNNDIVYSLSTDAGASFSGGSTDVRRLPVVSGTRAQAISDQYWQGAAFSPTGIFVASYYDRSYGDDNSTGFSDITVSATRNGTTFGHRRVTTSSMPPPTQFSGQFYGDYAALTVTRDSAYPVWSDTRTADEFLCPGTGTTTTPPSVCTGPAANAAVANDQETFTARVRP